MSERVDDEGNMETAVAKGEDHIGALPDELLQYVMSFLLSRDAVRTCVLAKRWRTLWKSVPALRISDPECYDSATGSSMFVDELLRLRDPTPLNVCHITSDCGEMVGDDPDWDDKAFQHMEPWLHYAVSSHVQELTVDFPLRLRVPDMTLISSHLKRLEFYRMRLEGRSLDLSRCQVLQVLRIAMCDIFADILSQSLKYLDINDTNFDSDTRTYIFAPNILGFELEVTRGLTPFIHSMPSVAAASVTLGEWCLDSCGCISFSCEGCRGEASDYSIVLEGLSGAKDLQLDVYDPSLFIFRKDLKWCPMFSKLKTLFLNGWCTDDNFSGLVYFLQHSPILETLTLQLYFDTEEEHHVIETDESYNSSEQSFLSKHLKAVKIICERKEDAMVHQILKILCSHGVPFEQIDIQ